MVSTEESDVIHRLPKLELSNYGIFDIHEIQK
jgi:hypothetical protein